ncbi:MAG: hypothetical protein WCJ14_08925 [Verrucomicrobiota bacterium]
MAGDSKPQPDRESPDSPQNQALASWGRPHLHSGIGIRRLTQSIFECRIGLDDRLAFVFIATPPELVFFFLGNHDAIQKLLRASG